MKKLIIAAAIVCATVAAQAANYNWNFNSQDAVYDGWNAATIGGNSANPVGKGLAAYLIAYDATSMNQNTILAGLRDGKSIETIAGSALLAQSATDKDSKIASAKWSDEVGASITAFEVIINGDGSSAYLSGENTFAAKQDPLESSIAWSTGTTKKLRDNDGTVNYSGSAGWYAVPEPTSGLLLLLGVAGLALRRRRA